MGGYSYGSLFLHHSSQWSQTWLVVMRRNRNTTKDEYIKVRIEQLKEDSNRARDDHDKAWYGRLIQELEWVLYHESV